MAKSRSGRTRGTEMRDPGRRTRGFTLLEVMVAVAILGLGLTAILSAQAGAFASAAHARNVSIATGLARCKMSEVEEHLAGPEGYPELDEEESGPCCDGDTTPNMRCTWKIAKPEFPEAHFGDLDLNASLSGLGLPGIGASSASPAAPPAPGGLPATGPNGLPDLSSVGGASGMAGMAMSFVYPILKPIYEASTRRVTVTLTWREGIKEHSLELMQWVTNPQIGGAVTDEQLDAAGLGSESTGSGGPVLPGGGATGGNPRGAERVTR
jgi:general secretion pathway protein I